MRGSSCADISDMAISIGNPGFGALKRGILIVLVSTALGTLLLLIIVASTAWSLGGSPLWVVVLGSAALGGELYWYRRDLREFAKFYREGKNWLKGARGERKVHAELMTLPDEFVVFNDFHPSDPKSGGRAAWNLDHIVVGPTGVFVIDAKDYSQGFVGAASRDDRTRKNAEQVDRYARELKDEMRRWSGGALKDVFVVPILAYAQEGAHVESLRSGYVRILPLRLLRGAILAHTERAIDMDKANRIAGVLYHQLPVNDRVPFEADLLRYGEIVRTFGTQGGRAREITAVRAAAPIPKRCPKCGTELEVYTAKGGPSRGRTFLRCPGYPGCKHTQALA